MRKSATILVIIALLMGMLTFSAPANAVETTTIINQDHIHQYLTETEGGIPWPNVSFDPAKGARFFKNTSLSSYERIGTVWTTFNQKYDGLRLEFSDINNTGPASPDLRARISVELTPNQVGATGINAGHKGVIFIPGTGFVGNQLIVNLGDMTTYPAGFARGNNFVDPAYIVPGKTPFAHLTTADATYSIQFNKVGDQFLVTVDDCAYYYIPAAVIEETLTLTGTTNQYADLPVGNAVINLRTWTAGAFDFYWNNVTTGTTAPVVPQRTIINQDHIHQYLTETEGGIPWANVSFDPAKGARFFKNTSLSSYERIGTVWTTFNQKYDGLRLEFSDINNTGPASPDLRARISVELTPNQVGATGINAGHKGVIFIPGTGFVGNQLIVNLGDMTTYPAGFARGNNFVDPFYIVPGATPFIHMTTADATYSIQFNKYGDQYLITVDDCAYYFIPAAVIEETLTLTGTTNQYADLPAGNAVINIRTWTAGAFDFYWNSVVTSTSVPVVPGAEPPDPTDVPAPTATPEPTAIPEPTATPGPTVTPEPTVTPAPTPAPGEPVIVGESHIHQYLTGVEGTVPWENIIFDPVKGTRFAKFTGLSGYERIGTNWETFNFPYDGLRLDFSDINNTGETADVRARISVELTPNAIGATGINPGHKGIIFIPATGFFGSTDLIISLGDMTTYPEGFERGINVVEATYVVPDSLPFAHMYNADSTYSIQFNKVGDQYQVVVDDCAFYRIPASLIEETLTLTGTTNQYNELPVGNAVINLRTWTAAPFDFYWNTVTYGLAAPEIPADPTGEPTVAPTEEPAATPTTEATAIPTDTASNDTSPETNDRTNSAPIIVFAIAGIMAAVLVVSKKRVIAK